MKKIGKYIFASLLTLALCGCESSETVDDAVVDAGAFVSASWTLSSATRESDSETLSNTLNITYGDSGNDGAGYLTFTDTTEDIVAHEWIIKAQDDGSEENIYLLSGTPESTTTQTELNNMIVKDWNYTSTESQMSLYFPKTGNYEVTLRNTFDKQIVFDFDGTDWRDVEVYSNVSKGVYIWEETFHVSVYDEDLVISYKVYSDYIDGVLTNEITDDKVANVMVGDYLYFEDCTEGDTDSWFWTCSGSSASSVFTTSANTKVAAILFNPDLTTDLTMTGIEVTLAVGREANYNNDTPVGYIVEETLDFTVNVTLDETMFVVNAPVLISDTEIEFDLSSVNSNGDECNAQFIPGADLDVSFFTISYTNNYNSATYAYDLTAGSPVPINVGSVVVTDDCKIRLTTLEKMYNTDTLQIKYTGEGDYAFAVANNKNVFDKDVDIPVAEPSAVNMVYDFADASQLNDWEIVTASSTAVNELDSDVFGIADGPFSSSDKCLRFDPSETALLNPVIRCNNTFNMDVANNKHFKATFQAARTYSSTTIAFSSTFLYPPYTVGTNIVNVYKDSVWDSTAGGNIPKYATSLYWQYYRVLTSPDEGSTAYTTVDFSFYPILDGDTPTAIDSFYEDIMLAILVSTYQGEVYIDNVIISNAEAR